MIPLRPRLLLSGLLALSGLLGATGCEEPPEVRTRQAFVLGTLVKITGAGVDGATFEEAAGAAFREMRTVHDALTPTRPDNLLGRFNRGAHRRWKPLEGPLEALLPRALSVQQASDNTFSPTLGRLISLWGFREPPFPDRPPASRPLASLLRSGAGDPALALRRQGVLAARLTRPGAALDLGGIAKGFAVDRAAAVLQERGVADALINAGGDMRALGRHGDRPWRIGIRSPRDKERVLAVLELAPGESVVTSGDYERTFRYQGTRYHHLLDPATGRPARTARQATVLGPRATEADAWSTALFVAGPEGLERLGPHQPGLVIDSRGRAHANAAMRRRLDWRSGKVDPP